MNVQPSEHIMNVLVAANLGMAGNPAAWRLGCGQFTDTPDQQVCIYDSPGEHPNPKWLLDYPYVQVIVRGAANGYQAANSMARNVYDVLLGANPRVMGNGDTIDAITVVGTPSHIGQDEKNRPLISANYRLIFEPKPTPLTNRQPL